MFITSTKYHKDISAAYARGLEQGFELARKLKQDGESRKNRASCSAVSPIKSQVEGSSLLSKQLIDIARDWGIDLE